VGNYDFEQAKRAARELLGHADRPDAIFVANDHMAIAVMDVIRGEFKLQIPHDISIVGFDNVPQAAWGAYDLTTVEQSVDPMVEATIALLHEQLAENPGACRQVVLPCQLVVRGSARITVV